MIEAVKEAAAKQGGSTCRRRSPRWRWRCGRSSRNGYRGGRSGRHPERFFNQRGSGAVPAKFYESVMHDPERRDPRGYIIPSDQADFPTATKFINALIKCGVTVERATAAFTVNGKQYPANSWVVKCAQAFRPHVLDMFEPQDHPNDFQYPGGPPVPPYDVTGYTLALPDGRPIRPHSGSIRRTVRKGEWRCRSRPPRKIPGPANRQAT